MKQIFIIIGAIFIIMTLFFHTIESFIYLVGVHNNKQERMYTNISNIETLLLGMTFLLLSNYV